jgi:2,3-dihydroxybiphenyl 1,2-dioxygenase
VIIVNQLAYVGAGSTDLDAWRSYAGEVLGHQVMPDTDNHALYLRCDDRHHRLVIAPADVDDVSYVGWEVNNRAALDRASSAISDAGVEVLEGSPGEADLRRVLGFSYFTCPFSGVRMELAYGHEAMFGPAFQPSRPLSGFHTGEHGLGHVVCYAPDVQKASDFYVNVLGFGVSDYTVIPRVGLLASFMHCNGRHHSLAFFAVPGAPRRIQHLMLQTNSIDDVGSTYDVCLDREITTTTLGRHPNDHSVSFYFRNPSGWNLEYAWEPRIINPETWVTEHFVAGRPDAYWGHRGLTEMV